MFMIIEEEEELALKNFILSKTNVWLKTLVSLGVEVDSSVKKGVNNVSRNLSTVLLFGFDESSDVNAVLLFFVFLSYASVWPDVLFEESLVELLID